MAKDYVRAAHTIEIRAHIASAKSLTAGVQDPLEGPGSSIGFQMFSHAA